MARAPARHVIGGVHPGQVVSEHGRAQGIGRIAVRVGGGRRAPDGTVTTLAPLPGPEDEDGFTLAAGSGLGVSRVLGPEAFAHAGNYTLRVRHGSVVSAAVEVDIGE
ncbi:hypothetical protein P873_11830 [Arenimonas composti TR7-09 = DSM 18010]|uniref:Uncharacterized protein n=1 Tax=Arenimonas composti TR7-09 = DSM 18010 TaxID=1121013 RepID=A0A091B9A9_9GAMM|nr:hypothetical protein P873_11830 [Arenimonas composti TR7-09 = DSM 18010]